MSYDIDLEYGETYTYPTLTVSLITATENHIIRALLGRVSKILYSHDVIRQSNLVACSFRVGLFLWHFHKPAPTIAAKGRHSVACPTDRPNIKAMTSPQGR